MAVTSVRDFLQLIEKSRLLQTAQSDELRTWPEQEPATLAARMVRSGWLTRWQSQQLLSGNSRFFYGKYKLLDQIGQGGMGSVYKAVWPGVDRMVALKVMSRSLLQQPKSVTRFLREIRSAAAVDHPNIVHAYDADCDGDTYFLVMEFVTGQNLKSWIKRGRPLPVEWSCECIRQAALGLQHAFEQGMVHRDIKPSNLLVAQHDGDGVPLVKILDLGLARFASETREDGDLTRSGQVLGTPDYIAPEQARNTKTADIRADIFSLGCTLFELVTGRLPFPGDSVMEKLMARATHDAPSMRLYRADIPAGLDAVVARMLARDPQFRFATPAAVADALAPFASGTAEPEPIAPMAVDSPAGVSTEGPPAMTIAASDSAGDGDLYGFSADLSRFAAEDTSRPERKPSGLWQQPPMRIAGGVVAALIVLGLIWRSQSGRNELPADATVHKAHSPKKHKNEVSDEAHRPAIGAENSREQESERETALWILQNGGTLRVADGVRRASDGPKPADGKRHPPVVARHEVRAADELPSGTWHIVEADLHGKSRLGKSDIERLAKLQHLESLSLADTQLADADLAPLRFLKSLVHLELQDTPISDAGIAWLKTLSDLQSLQLSRTRVSRAALDHLRSLPDLTELNLEGTRLSDRDLDPLAGMPQLTALNLAGTNVRGPGLRVVWQLKNLAILDLSGLQLGPNALNNPRGTADLRVLRLTRSKVTDEGLKHLSGMTDLRELLLGSTQITNEGLKHLTWMAELERLNLENTVVGDEGLKALQGLSSLKSLNLQGTVVSDSGTVHLAKLKGLELVDLSGTKLTRQGVASLQKELPNCKIEYK